MIKRDGSREASPCSRLVQGQKVELKLMAHFSLQLLVNPEAGQHGIAVTLSHVGITVKAYDPRLGDVEMWRHRTDEVPML